ncbi:MAG: hypothetical protein IKW91_05270 [Bacteroidaceae bacterium]|nr:hypothetical protein [Bacteroidaceae bacterium]
MKTKSFSLCLMLCASAFIFSGCVSKEQKAFDESVASRQISQLKQFIADFPEAGELLDSAKLILSEWEKDSADYVALKQTEDLVERYNLERAYEFSYPEGLFLDSVYAMMTDDAPVAQEILAKRAAIQGHLDEYRKKIENIIFYQSFEGGRHAIVMTPPDEEGKGKGAWVTIIDGWGGILDDGIKFRYEINTEDFEDDDIICHNIDNNALFTIEIYDKTLYVTVRGDLESFIGEKDVEEYKACLANLK